MKCCCISLKACKRQNGMLSSQCPNLNKFMLLVKSSDRTALVDGTISTGVAHKIDSADWNTPGTNMCAPHTPVNAHKERSSSRNSTPSNEHAHYRTRNDRPSAFPFRALRPHPHHNCVDPKAHTCTPKNPSLRRHNRELRGHNISSRKPERHHNDEAKSTAPRHPPKTPVIDRHPSPWSPGASAEERGTAPARCWIGSTTTTRSEH